ncbi:hypothetical protein FRC19_010434 [Serendipita sp. 401]|nr:hypothetical protein FRC19_010434 [Serendipita sp. 401]
MSSDSDTDVDVEFPRTKLVDTLETAHSVTVDDDRHPQGLYSYLSTGSVPPHLGHTGHVRKSLRRSAGRLDIRAPSCPEGSVQSCPDTEADPCCPIDAPICCVNNGKCCDSNYVCAGTIVYPNCCPIDSVVCSDGRCCTPGTTCCGTTCCPSGYTCAQGECVDTLLSSASVQSTVSVQSVASISSVSGLSLASISSLSWMSVTSVSIQSSISNAFVSQEGASNSDTITTADVKPGDTRIIYEPQNVWFVSSMTGSPSSSPTGACTNETKVTQAEGAKFTFLFQGTFIAIDIVPSSVGGNFTVSIDGGPAMNYTSILPDSTTGDQCTISRLVSVTGLEQAPHQMVVVNGVGPSGSTGGKLELSSITYTGKGAFETQEGSGPPSSTIIAGSVCGALLFIIIIGIIIYFVYRRRNTAHSRTSNEGAGTGGASTTDNNTMNKQTNAAAVISPYRILPSLSSAGHQSLPSYDRHQSFGHPQQPQYLPQKLQPGHQRNASNSAPIAPPPNLVERTYQTNDPVPLPTQPAGTSPMSPVARSSGIRAPLNVSDESMQQPNVLYQLRYAPDPRNPEL